jgi:hypothetical protein
MPQKESLFNDEKFIKIDYIYIYMALFSFSFFVEKGKYWVCVYVCVYFIFPHRMIDL